MTISALKLTAIGNSVGIVLPREVLAKLRVERGDSLYLTETPNGIEYRLQEWAVEEAR